MENIVGKTKQPYTTLQNGILWAILSVDTVCYFPLVLLSIYNFVVYVCRSDRWKNFPLTVFYALTFMILASRYTMVITEMQYIIRNDMNGAGRMD